MPISVASTGSPGDHVPVPRSHEGSDEDAAGPQHATQLQQPGCPSVGDVREHRHGHDDVEEAVGMTAGRAAARTRRRGTAGTGPAAPSRPTSHRCRNRGSRSVRPRPAGGAAAGPNRSRSPGSDRRRAGRRAGAGADPPSGGAPCRRSRAPTPRPRRPRRRTPPRPAAAWAAWTRRPRREHSGA